MTAWIVIGAIALVCIVIFACTRKCPICGGKKWGSHAFNCTWGRM